MPEAAHHIPQRPLRKGRWRREPLAGWKRTPASKDTARESCLSEGTQPEVKVLHSQLGCWGSLVSSLHKPSQALSHSGPRFVKRVKWPLPTVRCLAVVSVFRTFYMCLSLSEGQREASWDSTRNSDHREQYRMLLHGGLHEPPVGGCVCTPSPVGSLSGQHCWRCHPGPSSASALAHSPILSGPCLYLVLLME